MAGLGRFLTEARLAERLGGEHPYAYAINNPSTYVDPQGLAPQRQSQGKAKVPCCDMPGAPWSRLGQVYIDCNCLTQGVKISVLPENGDLIKNPPCGKWLPADAIIIGSGRFEQVYKIHGQTCAYFNCPPDDPKGCYAPRFEWVLCRVAHDWFGWKVWPTPIKDFCMEFCGRPCPPPCRGYP